MKKVILFVVIASLVPVGAVKASSFCASASGLAVEVMRGRQLGVTLVEAYETAESAEIDQTSKDIYKAIVMDAYTRPRYQTQGYRQQEIDEFGNQVYLACLKSSN